jgi:hypothetical protein
MLRHHLSQDHRDQVKPFLDRTVAGEDIAEAAVLAYEIFEEEQDVPHTGDQSSLPTPDRRT